MKLKLKKLILNLTYNIWHPPLVLIFFHAKRKKIINDEQLHTLCSMFDRTQKSHYMMEQKLK